METQHFCNGVVGRRKGGWPEARERKGNGKRRKGKKKGDDFNQPEKKGITSGRQLSRQLKEKKGRASIHLSYERERGREKSFFLRLFAGERKKGKTRRRSSSGG